MKIAFIGGGNMGASLIGGLIADGYDPKDITVSDHHSDRLTLLNQQYNIHTTTDNESASQGADVILFATKPQDMKTAIMDVKDTVQQRRSLIISVAAGVRETAIREWLGGDFGIVRCMPNTPALIQTGATGLYGNQFVTQEQRNWAETILRAVGIVHWFEKEDELDTVTALSGSGPAYFFLVMEALQNSAESLGLSKEAATLLTLQTALGAARMAMESEGTIEELRHRVTSPGGTTEAALNVLTNGGLDILFDKALKAAAGRSKELADKFN